MVIEVKNLNYRYKTFRKHKGFLGALRDLFLRDYIEKQAIKNLSFSLDRGKIIGLLGPNGAGKTTLIKLLTGLIHPTSGTVKVLGYTPYKKEKAFLKKIAVVLGQKSQLIWDLPAYDTFSMLKVVYEIDDKDFNDRLEMFSQLLRVEKCLDIPVRNLSLGERMKCELIASLLHQPAILFLDEPTIGMDLYSQQAIRRFLKVIVKKQKITVLLTSHHLNDIENLCDEIYILKEGAFCYQGKVQHLIDSCSQKVKIFYRTEKEEQSLECDSVHVKETLIHLLNHHQLVDLRLTKCSLEEAIGAVLQRD